MAIQDNFERVSKLFDGDVPNGIDPAELEAELAANDERLEIEDPLAATPTEQLEELIGEESPSYLRTLETISEEQ